MRSVRIRTARDRRVDAERPHVCRDQEVARRLGGAVRARRVERVRLRRGATRLEVAVDLVGRDLHEPRTRVAHVLEQHLRPAKLGAAEVLRREDRTVDVGLGGEVDDRLAAARRAGNVGGLRNVALVKVDVCRKIRAVARIGQLVEHDDIVACEQQPLGEMRADEARAACDEDAHRCRRLVRGGGKPAAEQARHPPVPLAEQAHRRRHD